MIANRDVNKIRITEPYTIFLRKLPSGKEVYYYYQYRDESGRRSPAYPTDTDKLSQARRVCNRLYDDGIGIQFDGKYYTLQLRSTRIARALIQ